MRRQAGAGFGWLRLPGEAADAKIGFDEVTVRSSSCRICFRQSRELE